MIGRRCRRAAASRQLLRCSAVMLALIGGCQREAQRSPRALSVFAASVLTDAFAELAPRFEAQHAGVAVALTFAGSQVLRLQIEQGAPADVFASADRGHLEALRRAGLVHAGQVFARNELVVVVPRSNPAAIASFSDLPRAQRLVLGAPTAPVGTYTRQLLQRAAVRRGPAFSAAVLAHVVSEESNVRLVRAKVELGEADAAIVYRTDAVACSRVRMVPVPEGLTVFAELHVAAVRRPARADLAQQWIAHLRSAEGQRILGRHGFLPAR